MHPVLKVIVVVQLIAAAVSGFLAASSVEELYPDNAVGEIYVQSPLGVEDAAAVLTDLSQQNDVHVARAVYAERDGGTSRVLETVPSDDGDPPAWWGGREPFPQFGTLLETSAVDYAPDDTLGRWVVYGSEAGWEALTWDMQDHGFVVTTTLVDTSLVVTIFRDSTPLIISVGGLGLVFVAALLSASRNTRVRAVEVIHGAGAATVVGREVLRAGVFIAGSTAAALAVWWLLAAVWWGTGQLFSRAGLIVALAIVATGLAALLLSGIASALAQVIVPRPLAQIQGVRPLATLQAVSALVCCLVIIGTLVSAQAAQNMKGRLDASVSALQAWEEEPDLNSIGVPFAGEDVVNDLYYEWDAFIDEVASRDRLLVNLPEYGCQFGTGAEPCLYVNSAYLDRETVQDAGNAPLTRDSVDPDRLTVLVPENFPVPTDAVARSLEDWAAFQAEMPALLGVCGDEGQPTCPSTGEIPAVQTISVAAGQNLSVFSGDPPPRPQDGALTDPLVIVLPDSGPVPSADFDLASVSQAKTLFLMDSVQLTRLTQQFGVDPLVLGIQAPLDAARSEVSRAGMWLAQNLIVAVSGLVGASALVITMAIIFCQRHRRPLFLAYLHGETFWFRYRAYFLQFLAISALSYGAAVALWSIYVTPEYTLSTLGILVWLGLLAVPALAVNDRRFRADYLKRP